MDKTDNLICIYLTPDKLWFTTLEQAQTIRPDSKLQINISQKVLPVFGFNFAPKYISKAITAKNKILINYARIMKQSLELGGAGI